MEQAAGGGVSGDADAALDAALDGVLEDLGLNAVPPVVDPSSHGGLGPPSHEKSGQQQRCATDSHLLMVKQAGEQSFPADRVPLADSRVETPVVPVPSKIQGFGYESFDICSPQKARTIRLAAAYEPADGQIAEAEDEASGDDYEGLEPEASIDTSKYAPGATGDGDKNRHILPEEAQIASMNSRGWQPNQRDHQELFDTWRPRLPSHNIMKNRRAENLREVGAMFFQDAFEAAQNLARQLHVAGRAADLELEQSVSGSVGTGSVKLSSQTELGSRERVGPSAGAELAMVRPDDDVHILTASAGRAGGAKAESIQRGVFLKTPSDECGIYCVQAAAAKAAKREAAAASWIHDSRILEISAPLTICVDLPLTVTSVGIGSGASQRQSCASAEGEAGKSASADHSSSAGGALEGTDLLGLVSACSRLRMESCRVQAFTRLAVGNHTLRLGSQDGREHMHLDESQDDVARRVADRFHIVGCSMDCTEVVRHSYTIAPASDLAGPSIPASGAGGPVAPASVEMSAPAFEASGETALPPPIRFEDFKVPSEYYEYLGRQSTVVPLPSADARKWLESLGADLAALQFMAEERPPPGKAGTIAFAELIPPEVGRIEAREDGGRALKRLGPYAPHAVPTPLAETLLACGLDLSLPAVRRGMKHQSACSKASESVYCPLPFDVELHQLHESGKRYLLDTHRLLSPDVHFIQRLRSDDSMRPKLWAASFAHGAPHKDYGLVTLKYIRPPRIPSRYTDKHAVWSHYFGSKLLQGAKEWLGSVDQEIAELVEQLHVHSVHAGAGIVLMVATDSGGTIGESESALVVAGCCPRMMHGRNANLSCMMPPEAAAVAKKRGLPRFCPDSRMAGSSSRSSTGSVARPGLLDAAILREHTQMTCDALHDKSSLEAADGSIGKQLDRLGQSSSLAWGGSLSAGETMAARKPSLQQLRTACKEGLHAVGLPLRSIGEVFSLKMHRQAAHQQDLAQDDSRDLNPQWSPALLRIAVASGLPSYVSPMADSLARALESAQDVAERVCGANIEAVAGVFELVAFWVVQGRVLSARGIELPEAEALVRDRVRQSSQSVTLDCTLEWLRCRYSEFSRRTEAANAASDSLGRREAPRSLETTDGLIVDEGKAEVIGIQSAVMQEAFKQMDDGTVDSANLVHHFSCLLRNVAHTQQVASDRDAYGGEVDQLLLLLGAALEHRVLRPLAPGLFLRAISVSSRPDATLVDAALLIGDAPTDALRHIAAVLSFVCLKPPFLEQLLRRFSGPATVLRCMFEIPEVQSADRLAQQLQHAQTERAIAQGFIIRDDRRLVVAPGAEAAGGHSSISDLANTIMSRGNALHAKGDIHGALDTLRVSLQLVEPFSCETGLFMSILSNLGLVYMDAGVPRTALDFMLRAEAMQIRLLRQDHSEALITQGHIAQTLKILGRFEEANARYVSLLRSIKSTFGILSNLYTRELYNAADCCMQGGDLEGAVRYGEQLETIGQELVRLGQGSEQLARALETLGTVYIKKQQLPLAIRTLRQSLEKFDATQHEAESVRHRERSRMCSIAARGNLATALLYSGDAASAMSMNEKCLEDLFAVSKGPEGPKHATYYLNVGVCACQMRKHDVAWASMQKAVGIMEAHCIPDEVPRLLDTINRAASSLAKHGAIRQAASLLGRGGNACKQATEGVLRNPMQEAGEFYANQAHLLVQSGAAVESLAAWRLAMERYSKWEDDQRQVPGWRPAARSTTPPQTAQISFQLAHALAQRGKFIEALEPATAMLERARLLLAPDHQTVGQAISVVQSIHGRIAGSFQ